MPDGGTNSRAEGIVDALLRNVRATLLQGGAVDAPYFDGWVARNRAAIVQLVEAEILPLLGGNAATGHDDAALPEAWTKAKRTSANLAAMDVLARVPSERMTDADRRIVAGYSGWGGLSIREAAPRFPVGLPVPDPQGLIHEFYTPSSVTSEVAKMIAPLLPGLVGESGRIRALEPSAGIGRFVRAMQRGPFDVVDWMAVEYSELSARALAAVAPDIKLYVGPFERWIREHGADFEGRVNLIVSNPPYGLRGASKAEDPDRSYRETMAYRYFIRRCVNLLAPGGLGVFLVPGGFMTSRTQPFVELRRKVLARAHLAAAFRLPSMNEAGREAIFPGAMLVTDLIVFRGREGVLAAPEPSDDSIVAGDYFTEYPRHVLGRVVGRDSGDDDQTAKPRWGYQIQGDFKGLPPLVERPICGECEVIPLRRPIRDENQGRKPGRVGVAKTAQDVDVSGYSEPTRDAIGLGVRVDRYLATLADEGELAPMIWPELVEALRAWSKVHGPPSASVELVNASKAGIHGAARFLSAYLPRTPELIPGLQVAPPKRAPVYSGAPNDVGAQAEMIYRTNRSLTAAQLQAFHQQVGGRTPNAAAALLATGRWYEDEDHLVPAEDYLTGSLWPKMDRAMKANRKENVRKLLAAIAPAVFDDINGVSARQGWVPIELVNGWINDTFTGGGYDPVELRREGGLTVPRGWTYDGLNKHESEIPPEVLLIVGWINHDKTLFSPSKKNDADNEKDIDKIRVRKAAEWDASFVGWVGAQVDRRLAIEHAYNRQFKGFVPPSYAALDLPIARWATGEGKPRLHPHQVAGARRVLANRGGLLAFDVGVGKTYTGLGIVARARQEGWCKRPVIVVPNSIAWKWYADIKRVLPDYRVGVIGSKQKIVARGTRKGQDTSDTDSPAERAAKWTKLQAGEFDVVIVTYSALGRTRMNEKMIRAYAEGTEAIKREIALRQRNAKKKKKLSEREEAILREGVAGWIAEQMELPEGQQYDPGIAWDDIGIDLLIVDEAQNFKNLYLPEDREGGVPRFMGNPGDGSKRAWQLDFRCAAVRRKTGGTGIVLLSATPAKNSPLEFYNLIQYVDPDAWRRMGIRDPEQFIDRYLKIEIKSIVTPTMEVEDRGAVVGFQNLHELRDVIFRYGEFKTAEDVGLKLPEPTVSMVEVDMDDAQDAKYDRYVREIEAALKSTDPSDKVQILGLLARMSLVSIHAELDEGYSWENASQVRDPSSPKFEALAERVLSNRTCGHIVFVDNVAAHHWVREVLVSAGVNRDRIGILNAKVAKQSADRQRIAQEFNGNPETGTPPKFDVVICNAIAYEGIDLQTRTCAIHHLDLPWEPATLQQRNGRGVRQGNTLAAIAIYYYFSRRSQDGMRFNLIQGKRGWMTQLIKSQDRDTNNPGAQMDLGPEEILLMISRNPEQTRARLEAVRQQREAEARKKLAEEAAKLLKSINARFRSAERTRDTEEAARLRGEAEVRLKQLAQTSAEAWPWAGTIHVVRDHAVVVVPSAGPLYEGLRVGIPSAWNAAKIDHAEFGHVEGSTIGFRAAGEGAWRAMEASDARLGNLKPEHYGVPFPADEGDFTLRAIEAIANDRLRYSGDWPGLRWHLAPGEWVDRMWSATGRTIMQALAKVSYYNAQTQKIPVLTRDGLRIVNATTALGMPATGGLQSAPVSGEPLPPTDSGWTTFLSAAPRSGLKFGELAEAGKWWWNRTIPRNLLTGTAQDEDDANARALAALPR